MLKGFKPKQQQQLLIFFSSWEQIARLTPYDIVNYLKGFSWEQARILNRLAYAKTGIVG